jgi:hypothetical protein
MLKQYTVLRHRSAEKDPTGTWLLAVKGRRVGKGAQRIRLTAQADLDGKVATESPTLLQEFLADREVDNPVARTLCDAFGNFGKLIEVGVPKVMFTLTSTRTRYTISLADSVIVEFSADAWLGTCGDKTVALYAFEFGLAHPGLYVDPGTSSSGGSMSGPPGSSKPSLGVGGYREEPPAYSRTYHVPQDLDNPALFEKKDFLAFHVLVKQVIREVLGFDPDLLEIGGDKGHQAATLLGLIG